MPLARTLLSFPARPEYGEAEVVPLICDEARFIAVTTSIVAVHRTLS